MADTTDARKNLDTWIDDGTLVRSEGTTTVSLTRAIASLCGFEGHGPLDDHGRKLRELIGEYDHYLLVLIDGLGMNQQTRLPADGFLASHFAGQLRSVFPSTTAAALTSLHSGLWPADHGIVGWFTHLPDHGETIIPLRAVERFTERSIQQLSIELRSVINGSSMFPDLDREFTAYTFRKFKSGQYADWANRGSHVEGYRNLKNAVKRVKRHLSHPSRGHRTFGYFYYSEVDHHSHEYGWESDEVASDIRSIDRHLKRIRAITPDSVRIVATADHGHINVPTERHDLLEPTDPILELLECPPSGEARVPLFHVKSGMESRFEEAFYTRFGGSGFTLFTPDDADARHFYGPGRLSEVTRSRIGTYLALSPEADAIEHVYEAGDPGVGHIGMHGGMSPDEVEVPLFLA